MQFLLRNTHSCFLLTSGSRASRARTRAGGRTEKFGADILKLCVKFGGVLSGEHGIGVEKRELMCEMFNNNDIQQQISIKNSLDPSSLLNPGKVYPILRKCAEEGRLHIHGRDKSKFSDIPRF